MSFEGYCVYTTKKSLQNLKNDMRLYCSFIIITQMQSKAFSLQRANILYVFSSTLLKPEKHREWIGD